MNITHDDEMKKENFYCAEKHTCKAKKQCSMCWFLVRKRQEETQNIIINHPIKQPVR